MKQGERVKIELGRRFLRMYQLADALGITSGALSLRLRNPNMSEEEADYYIRLIERGLPPQKKKERPAFWAGSGPKRDTSYFWLRVSRDKYEYPEVIADTVYELAEICGTSVDTIRSCVSRWERGLAGGAYRRVKKI